MKVSKDQHLKAERKCLSAAAAEWSVTRDQTPGAIWGYHRSTFFLKIFANMYRERKTWSSRKFGESIFFLAKMAFSRWKNLEQPSYIYALCQIAVLLGSVYVTFSCLNELASVFGRFNFWATLEKLRTYLSFLYHTQAGRKIHSWNMNHPGSIHPMYRQFIILFANFDLTASFLLVIAGCLYQSSLFLLFFKSTYTLTWM